MRRIGLDIDDTLGIFCADFLEFYNQLKRTNFRLEQIYALNIHKSIGITPEEERRLFDAYDESPRLMAMKSLSGSNEVINKLHSQGDYLMAITGRPAHTKEKTKLWLDQKYSGKIAELYFKPVGIRKAEMDLKVDIMIEDDINEALAFAKSGVMTYLLDYPWNRKVESQENLIRVYSWEELGKIL